MQLSPPIRQFRLNINLATEGSILVGFGMLTCHQANNTFCAAAAAAAAHAEADADADVTGATITKTASIDVIGGGR